MVATRTNALFETEHTAARLVKKIRGLTCNSPVALLPLIRIQNSGFGLPGEDRAQDYGLGFFLPPTSDS